MDPLMPVLLIVAFLALVSLFAFALTKIWRHVAHQDGPLPFFLMLGRRGLAVDAAVDQYGPEVTARAVRRCALCSSGEKCRDLADAGLPAPADCPNTGLFARLSSPGA